MACILLIRILRDPILILLACNVTISIILPSRLIAPAPVAVPFSTAGAKDCYYFLGPFNFSFSRNKNFMDWVNLRRVNNTFSGIS